MKIASLINKSTLLQISQQMRHHFKVYKSNNNYNITECCNYPFTEGTHLYSQQPLATDIHTHIKHLYYSDTSSIGGRVTVGVRVGVISVGVTMTHVTHPVECVGQ